MKPSVWEMKLLSPVFCPGFTAKHCFNTHPALALGMNIPSWEKFPPWSKISCALRGLHPVWPRKFRGSKKWPRGILRRSDESQKQEALNHLLLPAAVVLFPSGCRSALPMLFNILPSSSFAGGSAKVGWRVLGAAGASPSTCHFSWQSSSISTQSVSLFHPATGRMTHPSFFYYSLLSVCFPPWNKPSNCLFIAAEEGGGWGVGADDWWPNFIL